MFGLYFFFCPFLFFALVCVRAPYCQMHRSSWCWWKSKIRHNTFKLCRCMYCFWSPIQSMEQGRSWSNLRTNPDTCIIPFLWRRRPGFQEGVGCCGCIAFNWILGTNTDLISTQILARSPSTNPGTCYRMLDPPLHFYISRFYSHCSAFGRFDYMICPYREI